MEWPRLKNIILLMLVLVNLFLLVINIRQAGSTASYEEEGRTSVIGMFQNGGISLNEDTVPWGQALTSLFMTRDRDQEESCAKEILGDVQETDRGNLMEYQSNLGEFWVSRTGEFDLILNEGLSGEDPARTAAPEDLKMLGIDAELIDSWTEEGKAIVLMRQTWNGMPVYNCIIELEYSGNLLRQVTGTRLTGTPKSGSGEEPLSDLTLLVRFLNGMNQLGDVCTRVDSIRPGYGFTPGLSDPILLVPEWYITTDTNEYYLNCLTGELTRAES